MRHLVRFAAVAAALTLSAAATAGAQDTAAKKPGGLNAVAHNVSKTVKKAGQDTKAEVHRDASKTHNTLTDAGNGTKNVIKKTTGLHGSHASKPGGLNAVAHNISNTSKKAASDTKGAVKDAKSDVHGKLTETGKSVKDTTLKKP